MKLIAASATLLAALNAQSIDVLVMDLVQKVYQVSDDGLTHTINAAPYLKATINCLGEGFTSEGSYGNGKGVFSWTGEADWTNGDHFHYEIAQSGRIGNHPGATWGLFPAEVHDDFVESTAEFNISPSGIFIKDSGEVNKIPYTVQAELSLGEVSMNRKNVGAEIELTRYVNFPSSIKKFWRDNSLPSGSSTVSIDASAKTACSENLLQQACQAKLIITGENNGQDFGRNVAKYSVQAKRAQFFVNHNKQEVFKMVLSGIDTMEVLALKYAVNAGPTTLIIQCVGPAGIEAVAVAAEKFITPFAAFVAAMNTAEDTIHAVVYSDAIFKAAQGQDYFNFYPVIEATQFESEVLSFFLRIRSVQGAAKQILNDVNTDVEGLMEDVAPMISEARTYVHEITGAEGETVFGAWFAQI
jgi:hypothetical protein